MATKFKRDFKREKKGQHQATIESELFAVVEKLAKDLPLEPKFRDHALSNNWQGFRDCHIKPDLVLIYRKVDKENGNSILEILELARLGSHSELSL